MNEFHLTKRAEHLLNTAYRDALTLGSSTIDTPNIARALNRELRQVDWEQVGRAVGEVLAEACMNFLAQDAADRDAVDTRIDSVIRSAIAYVDPGAAS